MKILLSLPNTTYERVLAKAQNEGLDPGLYLSVFVADQIDKQYQGKITAPKTSELGREDVSPEKTSTKDTLPDTVEQIIAICTYIWKYNYMYGDAVRKVALDNNIQNTTVRDKCTRRISFPRERITTEAFLDLLSK